MLDHRARLQRQCLILPTRCNHIEALSGSLHFPTRPAHLTFVQAASTPSRPVPCLATISLQASSRFWYPPFDGSATARTLKPCRVRRLRSPVRGTYGLNEPRSGEDESRSTRSWRTDRLATSSADISSRSTFKLCTYPCRWVSFQTLADVRPSRQKLSTWRGSVQVSDQIR